MKTRDKYDIYVGMCIYDHNGIYEIKEIKDGYTMVNVIEFDNDYGDEYTIVDVIRMNKTEIANCYYI